MFKTITATVFATTLFALSAMTPAAASGPLGLIIYLDTNTCLGVISKYGCPKNGKKVCVRLKMATSGKTMRRFCCGCDKNGFPAEVK